MKAITFLFPIIFFFSCTTQPTVSSETSAITGMAYNDVDGFDASGYSGGKISYSAGSAKVIIHNANVRVTVKNVDSLHNDLKRISEAYGGYVLTLGDREAVIRVKAGSINPALAEIARTGKLKSKTVRGEDVTE